MPIGSGGEPTWVHPSILSPLLPPPFQVSPSLSPGVDGISSKLCGRLISELVSSISSEGV